MSQPHESYLHEQPAAKSLAELAIHIKVAQ